MSTMLFGRSNTQRVILFPLALGGILLLTFYYIKPQTTSNINKESFSSTPPTVSHLVRQTPLTEDDFLQEIEKTALNLPVTFWKKHRFSGLKLNSSCALFPHILDVQYNNLIWQTLVTSNGTFQLLNAYLDNRKHNKNGPTVRLLGMIDRIDPNVTTFCQIWYNEKKVPLIVEAEYTYIWRKEWMQFKKGDYESYLISCNIPKGNASDIPAAVSLVENQCSTARNFLKVLFAQTGKKSDFAVCVKGLDYAHEDVSIRLVEWLELLDILGVGMVYFYKYNVHPNVTKLLDYYEERGTIQVSPFQLAGGQPNLPALRSYYFRKQIHRKRINEIVPYNDCFYKHMHEFKYIALLDIDEIIMPSYVNTWQELLVEIKRDLKEEKSSYSAQNRYFFDSLDHNHGWFSNIPKHMYMLQHVHRSVNVTVGHYVKTFFNTDDVLTLHNHYPFSCLDVCRTYDIDVKYAQLQHYRTDCVSELKKNCTDIKNNLVMDTNIWRYKETLIKRVRKTLNKLGLM